MALNIAATDFGRPLRRCADVFRAPHVVDFTKPPACSIRIRRGKLSDALLERSRTAPLKFLYTMTLKVSDETGMRMNLSLVRYEASRSSEDCADTRTNASVCVA